MKILKQRGGGRGQYIDNYIQTLQNLAHEGVTTVCYNFMPVLDWTRTHLDYRLVNGASALLYHAPALAAFDLYILQREGAFTQFSAREQATAKLYLDGLSNDGKTLLTNTILAGLPGTNEVFSIAEFKNHLNKYSAIDAQALKANLFYFLRAIIPHAEKLGMKMCIHPDDPPFPILGLPRVVSSLDDLKDIINCYPSIANGVTLCTGSLGAVDNNDIPEIIKQVGDKIHFLHLRNVTRLPDGGFYEADHLTGSVDMYQVMKAVINEQVARKKAGRDDIAIPMRPDHGHKLLDDFNYNTYPGYSAIGRLKGLAELRGLEMGIKRTLFDY